VRLLIVAQLLTAVTYAIPILSSDRLKGSDFVCFYAAWSIVRDGHGANLYNLDLQRVYQAPLSDFSQFHFLPFINPPHAALLFMPFAYIPPNWAVFINLAFNCLIAGWVLYRLWQLAANWTKAERILLLTTFLATEVFWYGLGVGAITALVFAFLIEYCLALQAGRDIRAAIWLIAATLKPQLILFPALIPLAQQRWRVVGVAVTLGLIIFVAVSVGLGFHVWLDYVRLLREVSVHGDVYGASPWLMNNVRMLLYWTFPSAYVVPVVYFLLIGGAAAIFWLWRSAHRFPVRFGLTVLLGLFVAPYLHHQDTLIAMLPAAFAYDFARDKRPGFLPVFQILVLAASFLPVSIILIRIFTTSGDSLAWIWPMPLIVILLIVCILELRDHRT